MSPYPEAVPTWMVGEARSRVLDLGSGNGRFAAMMRADGHEVFCLDRAVDQVSELSSRLGTRLHVAGQVEAMPYLSCHFDVVTAAQTLHHFAPGLALTEIARVLKPGGQLAIAYNTRDDTVPWVKRLIGLVRQADPKSMQGDFGVDSVETYLNSPYFTQTERKNFRNWVPITRSGLITMVERGAAVAALPEESLTDLLNDVGQLYDTSARAPDPLLLPFQTTCWRATVDHSGLVIEDDLDHALEIRI